MFNVKDIPHCYTNIHEQLSIKIPEGIKELPEIYNQLTDEVNGYLFIENNQHLKYINSFKNLTEIGGQLSIYDNKELTHITGFNNLTKTGISIRNNKNLTYVTGFNNLNSSDELTIRGNNKLISLSLPHTIINSFDYSDSHLHIFNLQEELINHQNTIQDCIDKFNPLIHPDIVVKQIIENLELWGEPNTINIVVNHLLDKAPHLADVIPIEFLNSYHNQTIKRNNRIIKKIFV